jgi:hypothetical protein
MREVAIGWDVGAWHCESGTSRDTLCALVPGKDGRPRLDGKPWRGGLRETLNANQGQALIRALLQLAEVEPDGPVSVTIAIDTPLGWPQAFLDLLTHRRMPDSIHEMKLKNELLYRRTESLLIDNGHRPLSVVQDMISSQSTKGMFFLGRTGLTQVQTGIWSGDVEDETLRLTAIETYPAPCRARGVLAENFAEISLHERFVKECRKGDHVASDVNDSLYCALVAFAFARDRKELLSPEEAGDESGHEEGWIWVPKGCYSQWPGKSDAAR